MRPKARAALHCCLILFFALGLIAQDAPKVSCPDSIRVVDPQLAKPLQGWKVSVGNIPHRLSRVTFYDGPVEAQTSLVPDHETGARKTKTAVWLLNAKSERAYWLGCSYSGTSLSLARALPSGLTECRVTYDTAAQIEGMPVIKAISCK